MGIECRSREVESVDHTRKGVKAARVGLFCDVLEGSIIGLPADSDPCGADSRHRAT
jgi:hypothetical protein